MLLHSLEDFPYTLLLALEDFLCWLLYTLEGVAGGVGEVAAESEASVVCVVMMKIGDGARWWEW